MKLLWYVRLFLNLTFNQTFQKFPGNAFKMSSSSWASKRQSRENWAEEVIAAAMKTGSEEGKKWYFVTKIVLTYCEKKLF